MVGGVGRIEDPPQVREPFGVPLVDDRAPAPCEQHQPQIGGGSYRQVPRLRLLGHGVGGIGVPAGRGHQRLDQPGRVSPVALPGLRSQPGRLVRGGQRGWDPRRMQGRPRLCHQRLDEQAQAPLPAQAVDARLEEG